MSELAREAATKASGGLRVLFIGKRFYTNNDALEQRFGRIHHLPYEWAKSNPGLRCWLVDYHTRQILQVQDGPLRVDSIPALSLGSLKLLVEACRRIRPQIVVVSGDCYLGLLGWFIARVCGARLVFDIYDKYDEFGGYIRPLGWDLFAFLRRRSDLRFYASRYLAQYFNDLGASGCCIVQNGVDEDLFRPMDLGKCREQLGLDPHSTLIGYFGSLEPERGVTDLIEAVGEIHRKSQGTFLVICGASRPGIRMDQPWVIYRGLVSHRQMPSYLNACDVLAIPYRRSVLLDSSSSCKIAEYHSCGRPIVSTRTPNFTQNFPDAAATMGPALCNPGDVPDLVRAIEHQLQSPIAAQPIPGMSWSSIALHALDALRRVADSGRQ